MAMESEAKTFIDTFNFDKCIKTSPYGFKNYHLKNNNYEINLFVGESDKKFNVQSVGTVPSAIAVDQMIRSFSPDLIINAGTAGGFKSRGANIGDVYIINSTQFHDRRIEIPGYAEYGRYFLKHENDFYKKIKKQLNLKSGLLSTGDSLDYIDTDKKLVEGREASVKDMEGAAIAWTCYHNQIPAVFIKSITDIVDGPYSTVDEFLLNLQEASQNLSKALIRLIEGGCI